jgi:hypothetical protein
VTEWDCAGCGEPVPDDAQGSIWCRTPLGMGVLHTHRSQDCGRAALAAHPDWTMYPGNVPPGGTDEEVRARARGQRPEEPREDRVRSG